MTHVRAVKEGTEQVIMCDVRNVNFVLEYSIMVLKDDSFMSV